MIGALNSGLQVATVTAIARPMSEGEEPSVFVGNTNSGKTLEDYFNQLESARVAGTCPQK